MEEKEFLENENQREICNQKITKDNEDEKWDQKIEELASSYQHFSSNLFQENKSEGEIEEMKIPEKLMIYKWINYSNILSKAIEQKILVTISAQIWGKG